jgi:hypothetical protein
MEPGDPGVVVDVVFEEGLLFLAVRNISSRPAYRVRARFRPAIGGVRRVSRLALFRRLEFLAPGREIRTLLDSAARYFGRDEPGAFQVTVTYETADGRRHRHVVPHDLEIYRDLAWVAREEIHGSRA